MRCQTVAYCVEDGCRCDDRRGVVLYDGTSEEDARQALADLVPHGYEGELTLLPPSSGGK